MFSFEFWRRRLWRLTTPPGIDFDPDSEEQM
jgi:hypothetical protein